MFADEIKWLVGSLLIGAVLIFGIIKITPNGFFRKLFGSERQTIQDTPLAVKEIRGIGELISAEYYGEVIHSLNDGFESLTQNQIQVYYDSLHSHLNRVYDQALAENTRRRVKEDRIWDQVMQDDRLNFMMGQSFFQVLQQTDGLKPREKRKMCEVVKTLVWRSYLDRSNRSETLDKVIKELGRDSRGRIELTYLGRGWVKAGYDLSKLTEIQIEREGDTLFIRDIDPEVLNADINPWFIPPSKLYKNGSHGFTLLRSQINGVPKDEVESGDDLRSDRKKIPLWAIDSVKKGTKRALLLDAMGRHILDTAQVSAERTLLRLFQLVEPDTLAQIQHLYLVPTDWFVRQQEVLAGDYCLDSAETRQLAMAFTEDTIAANNNRRIDKMRPVRRWQRFVTELDALTLCVANDPAWASWKDSIMGIGAAVLPVDAD